MSSHLKIVTGEIRSDLLDTVKPKKSLQPGGGDGSSGGMEQRIAGLEDAMKEVKSDIKGLRKDVSDLAIAIAELKGKVGMLPGYGGIALIVGLIVALSTAAQIGAKFIP